MWIYVSMILCGKDGVLQINACTLSEDHIFTT